MQVNGMVGSLTVPPGELGAFVVSWLLDAGAMAMRVERGAANRFDMMDVVTRSEQT